MATFEAQIESLTGLTISSSGTTPSQAEVTQFLRDGLTEVINRIISLKPEELIKFTKTTNDTNAVNLRGRILAVMREHDSTAVLRRCDQIEPAARYDSTDVNSLHYRSKYNPGFYVLNGSIYTVPAAGSGDNDVVVTQVHYDTAIAYTDDEDNIENFPHEYAYLVTLYAAIKSLEAKMADYVITEEDQELVTAISSSIITLQNQYRDAFIPSQERQGQTSEER
jgi:hypothetical protein